jgi:HEAT repeat protein
LLNDPESSVREAAADTLAGFGRRAEPSIPALVRSVRAGPDRRCLKAASVLASIGEPAVPALIELLKDRDPEVRKTVLENLSGSAM